MGCSRQLRILLWKNWKLKRRSAVVTVAEFLIPITLIVILVALRAGSKPYPVQTEYFPARPLPSAGLLPLLELACPAGTQDDYGFINQEHSVTNQVLGILDRMGNLILNLTDLRSGPGNDPELDIIDTILQSDYWKSTSFATDEFTSSSVTPMLASILKYAERVSSHKMETSSAAWWEVTQTIRDVRDEASSGDLPAQCPDVGQTEAPPYTAAGPADRYLQFSKMVMYIKRLVCDPMVNGTSQEARDVEEEEEEEAETQDPVSSVQKALMRLIDYPPRILYAPKDTEADIVIREVEGILAIVDDLSKMATDWLQISDDVREMLKESFGGDESLNETTSVMPEEDDSRVTGHVTEDGGVQQLLVSPAASPAHIPSPEVTSPSSSIPHNSSPTSTRPTQRVTMTSSQTSSSPSSSSSYQDNYSHATDSEFTRDDLQPTRPPFAWPTDFPVISDAIRIALYELTEVLDTMACTWLQAVDGNFQLDDVFQGFDNEAQLIEYFLEDAYKDDVTVLAGILFDVDPDGHLPRPVTYKIRQNASMTPTTSLVRPPFWNPSPDPTSDMYYYLGFAWIQDLVERALVNVVTGDQISEPGAYVQKFPQPCYRADDFQFNIEYVLPLCLMVSWMMIVASLTRVIVYEKEHRLREVMKLMGLRQSVLWASWFITTTIQSTLIVAVITMLLKVGHVLTYSDGFLIFVFLELYALNAILLAFLVSTVFNQAKIAAACAGILYLISYVPYMYIGILEGAGQPQVYWAKCLVSIFGTTAVGLCCKHLAYFEISGQGVNWQTMRESPLSDEPYNMMVGMVIMAASTLFMALLVWYIGEVRPGPVGQPRPWYFPCTRGYWCRPRSVRSLGSEAGLPEGGQVDDEEDRDTLSQTQDSSGANSIDRTFLQNILQATHRVSAELIEEEPTHLPKTIEMECLTKVFPPNKIAVNGLSLKLYEGQILSFLGHNGAGKTTTMSMLTGMLPITSGSASIYGRDVGREMDSIRNLLGMCPQYNVLFDSLTVEEHLIFYASLKGAEGEFLRREVNSLVLDLGLMDKRQCAASTLSGGMKRKLCVGMAFIGGSKAVILDEPTAGVDPCSRRDIWDLLLKYKEDRTIMLSTHHMDEADLLGDRIAVVSAGRLLCCGSSIFLKSTLGEGYHLRIVRSRPPTPSQPHQHPPSVSSEESVSQDDVDLEMKVVSPSSSTSSVDDDTRSEGQSSSQSASPSADSSNRRSTLLRLSMFIKSYVPGAYMKNEAGRELHFVLPFTGLQHGALPALFEALEGDRDSLNIETYGVSDTSLEEVFLRIVSGGVDVGYGGKGSSNMRLDSDSSSDSGYHGIRSLGEEPFDGAGAQGGALPGSLPESLGGGGRPAYRRHASEAPFRASSTASLAKAAFRRAVSWDSRDRRRVGPYARMHEGLDDVLAVQNKKQQRDMDTMDNVPTTRGHSLLDGCKLGAQQFSACLHKRFLYTIRNWKQLILQCLLPTLFIVIAMVMAKAGGGGLSEDPGLELSTSQYNTVSMPTGWNVLPVANQARYGNTSRSAGVSDLLRTFNMAPGFGAHCVLNSTHPEDDEGYTYAPGCEEYLPYDNPPWAVPPLAINGSVMPYPQCFCLPDQRYVQCDYRGFQSPPNRTTVTRDMLQFTDDVNETEFLFNTDGLYVRSRYGSLSFGNVRPYVPTWLGTTRLRLDRIITRNVAKVLHHSHGLHSMPAYTNGLNNAILRANMAPGRGDPGAYGIRVTNHPMNGTTSLQSVMSHAASTDLVVAIFVAGGMAFVPSGFVLFLVLERTKKAKLLQYVSGLGPSIYWVSVLLADLIVYLVPAWIALGIVKLFDAPAYAEGEHFLAIIALFMMYGVGCVPLMYPTSFLFDDASTAYVFVAIFNICTGIALLFVSFVLQNLQNGAFASVASIIDDVLMVFPSFAFGHTLMDISNNYIANQIRVSITLEEPISPLSWGVSGKAFVALGGLGVISFIIVILMELDICADPRSQAAKAPGETSRDPDVAAERRRVLQGAAPHDIVRIENLTKIYKTGNGKRHLAVDQLCLGIPRGECFGMLGVNGAGKTTTFQMLTGDQVPSAGDALIANHSIVREKNIVRQNIGYCPQFDALYEELTAREHLTLYGRLRGIPGSHMKQAVDYALNTLQLGQYADKKSGTYSGGNKRKLSTAIALMGNPEVIFLDEPTAGMDPYAKRFLWDVILGLIKAGKCLILTSHSMEECETLCTRLAIMVRGRFLCLGNVQHLKTRFGDGYSIHVTVGGPDFARNVSAVKFYMERDLQEACLKEEHFKMLHYEIPRDQVCLSRIFRKMETAKKTFPVEEYSVSQNTLDNVFVNFVKQQPTEPEAGDDIRASIGKDDEEASVTTVGCRAKHAPRLSHSVSLGETAIDMEPQRDVSDNDTFRSTAC